MACTFHSIEHLRIDLVACYESVLHLFTILLSKEVTSVSIFKLFYTNTLHATSRRDNLLSTDCIRIDNLQGFKVGFHADVEFIHLTHGLSCFSIIVDDSPTCSAYVVAYLNRLVTRNLSLASIILVFAEE